MRETAYVFYLALKSNINKRHKKLELKTLYFNFDSLLQNRFLRSYLEEMKNYWSLVV